MQKTAMGARQYGIATGGLTVKIILQQVALLTRQYVGAGTATDGLTDKTKLKKIVSLERSLCNIWPK
jgi:hypothetical protein